MKKIIFLLTLVIIGTTIQAQDKVYRKNGEILKVKILEVSSDEVKYKLFGKDDGPIYVLERDRIKKIVYEDGRTESTTVNIKDPEQYAEQMKKAIKVDFLGPLLGYSQFSFEKSTGVGKGYELSLGIIGAGKNQVIDYYDNQFRSKRKNQFGIAVGAGYKFNKLPDFLFGRTRFTHLMQGTYVKPIVYLGNYSEDRVFYKASQQVVLERDNISFGALQLELGKQWIFGDKFGLDIYWGFGYGFDNKKSRYEDDFYNDDMSAYNYINARLGRSPGFSTTFGIKLGMLIK
jgi:hypothetical protein